MDYDTLYSTNTRLRYGRMDLTDYYVQPGQTPVTVGKPQQAVRPPRRSGNHVPYAWFLRHMGLEDTPESRTQFEEYVKTKHPEYLPKQLPKTDVSRPLSPGQSVGLPSYGVPEYDDRYGTFPHLGN